MFLYTTPLIVNLNANENHVQYVYSKTDDPLRVTQYTVRELSYRKHKNWKKKNLTKSMTNFIPRRPGMTYEQRERAIGMLTAGMSARDLARHFQHHESTMSRLLNRFQQTVTSRTDPDQADRVKPRRGKTVFSRLHLDAIDFFLVES